MSAEQASGGPGRWVLLSYRLPREPSTPRIGVWRKLERLGWPGSATGWWRCRPTPAPASNWTG
jgi:hypothetical protein